MEQIIDCIGSNGQTGDINHVTGDIHFMTCLFKRQRTVLTIHDCGFMHHPSRVARFIFKWLWLKLPVWCSAIVTVVSEATKAEVLKHVHCHPDKIKVIHNFISDHFTRRPRSFNLQKPNILHVGTAQQKPGAIDNGYRWNNLPVKYYWKAVLRPTTVVSKTRY